MTNTPIELKVSADDPLLAYLYLPGHPRASTAGVVANSVRVSDLVPHTGGLQVVFDLDQSGKIIGIEIVGDEKDL